MHTRQFHPARSAAFAIVLAAPPLPEGPAPRVLRGHEDIVWSLSWSRDGE